LFWHHNAFSSKPIASRVRYKSAINGMLFEIGMASTKTLLK